MTRRLRTNICALLCALVGVSCLYMGITTNAKSTLSSEICVVYDNSASTFRDETWCRYKYALEIFATMIDYENGSKLHIYPLCEVTTGGGKDSASCEPITINNYNEISKITNMYTVSPKDTPFEPVENAYNYLKNNSVATNKRLLILTDGEFNDATVNLQERLDGMANASKVKIHYFGSGDAVAVRANESNGLYAQHVDTATTSNLIDAMLVICADLFNQTTLTTSMSNITNFQLNSTVDKIIVWASGDDADIVSLVGQDGNRISVVSDAGKHTYSSLSAAHFGNAPTDKTLFSHIVIYDECDAGKYVLTCENADSIKIFYQYNSDAGNSDKIGVSLDAVQQEDEVFFDIEQMLILIIGLTGITISVLYILYVHKNHSLRRRNKSLESEIASLKHDEEKRKTIATIDGVKQEGYVFISYSSKNHSSAIAIREFFRKHNISTWMAPNDIPVGSKYPRVISRALKECSCLVLLLTNDSQNSVWVAKEVERAINYKKTIIPIQLEDVILNDEFEMYISTDQIIAIEKIEEMSDDMRKVLLSVRACVD